MFQLRQLKTFLAAAETLSFTKAAELVHLSQPSVTGQVQALEESIGRALFLRTNNRLTLTEAGHSLVSRARELLAMADDALVAVRDNTDADIGTISVAAPHSLCATLLAPVAARYAGLHSSAYVSVHEKNSADTELAVLERAADIGLVHGWPRQDLPNLQVEVISRDIPVVLMPAAHPLGDMAEVKLEALAPAAFLLTPNGCRYREYAQALLQHAPIRPHIRAEADGVSSLVQMVAAGLGVSILPRKAVDLAKAGSQVHVRPLAGAGEGLPICMLSAGEGAARPQLVALMEMLREAAADSNEPMPSLDMQHDAGRKAIA